MRKLRLQMQVSVNATAIGKGIQEFKSRQPLKLKASTAYPSGIVVNSYERAGSA
jgi:hypothetical protein